MQLFVHLWQKSVTRAAANWRSNLWLNIFCCNLNALAPVEAVILLMFAR